MLSQRPAMKVELRLAEILYQQDPPMSGRELSRRTGVRHRSIHYMMNGQAKHIPLDNLAMICEVLNCDITDLMVLVPNTDPIEETGEASDVDPEDQEEADNEA